MIAIFFDLTTMGRFTVAPIHCPPELIFFPTMKLRRPWTSEEESNLLEWVSKGVSLAIVSIRLKRSVMAVQNRYYQLRDKQEPASEDGSSP